MRASHILIKHEGSRRKASWRDPDGVAISATTRDDAADLARALRDQIAAGELQFDAAARDNSDCNSAKRGGDLGTNISVGYTTIRYKDVAIYYFSKNKKLTN